MFTEKLEMAVNNKGEEKKLTSFTINGEEVDRVELLHYSKTPNSPEFKRFLIEKAFRDRGLKMIRVDGKPAIAGEEEFSAAWQKFKYASFLNGMKYPVLLKDVINDYEGDKLMADFFKEYANYIGSYEDNYKKAKQEISYVPAAKKAEAPKKEMAANTETPKKEAEVKKAEAPKKETAAKTESSKKETAAKEEVVIEAPKKETITAGAEAAKSLLEANREKAVVQPIQALKTIDLAVNAETGSQITTEQPAQAEAIPAKEEMSLAELFTNRVLEKFSHTKHPKGQLKFSEINDLIEFVYSPEDKANKGHVVTVDVNGKLYNGSVKWFKGPAVMMPEIETRGVWFVPENGDVSELVDYLINGKFPDRDDEVKTQIQLMKQINRYVDLASIPADKLQELYPIIANNLATIKTRATAEEGCTKRYSYLAPASSNKISALNSAGTKLTYMGKAVSAGTIDTIFLDKDMVIEQVAKPVSKEQQPEIQAAYEQATANAEIPKEAEPVAETKVEEVTNK